MKDLLEHYTQDSIDMNKHKDLIIIDEQNKRKEQAAKKRKAQALKTRKAKLAAAKRRKRSKS